MNKHHRTLELDRVLEMLAEQTTCPAGRELARQLTPNDNYRDAADALQRTADINSLCARYGTPGLGGIRDCTGALQRAKLGARLSAGEILQVAQVLRTVRSIKKWRGQGETPTAADDLFHILAPVEGLEKDIFDAILSEEELADSASPALADLRRRIRRAQLKVREQLDGIIRSPQYAKALQEPIVTMRDGRFVVPVKIECKNEVKGLVHDTSSSGATVFIEPMAVVDANNEIRLLQNEEQLEIDRILQEFSERIGQVADATRTSFEALLQLDLLFAKSRLADKMKATVPELNEDGIIEFGKARHPLIQKDKVVPVDIRLGDGFDTLVITGPNTGGKTVALKTLGLLTLMAACGMMLPVASGSRAAVFTHVLADIGDEQSIEQSLSTFSSHIVKIIEILKIADDNSLVLTDELGAGTDPTEGAALAVSIITALRQRGVQLAATTHYAEVKMYALQTPGVENGCCEFDVATLSPTYRLLIGVPGRSNAFAISRRLGLPEEIIDEAKSMVSTENTRFEDVVSELESTRQQLENEVTAAETARGEADRLRAEMKKQAEAHEAAMEKLEADARDAARALVERTRSRTDLLLNELEELKKQKDKADFSEKVAAMRQGYNRRIEELRDTADPVKERKTEEYHLPRALREGDTVTVAAINRQGTVIAGPDKSGAYQIQLGNMKMKCAPEELRLPEDATKPPKKKQPVGGTRTSRPGNTEREARTELDIRGMASDEGLMEVDRFLDRCLMMGIKNVTIIHGKGTGVLRAAVQQHLRRLGYVKSQRPGMYGEGEAGVTVVELK